MTQRLTPEREAEMRRRVEESTEQMWSPTMTGFAKELLAELDAVRADLKELVETSNRLATFVRADVHLDGNVGNITYRTANDVDGILRRLEGKL